MFFDLFPSRNLIGVSHIKGPGVLSVAVTRQTFTFQQLLLSHQHRGVPAELHGTLTERKVTKKGPLEVEGQWERQMKPFCLCTCSLGRAKANSLMRCYSHYVCYMLSLLCAPLVSDYCVLNLQKLVPDSHFKWILKGLRYWLMLSFARTYQS